MIIKKDYIRYEKTKEKYITFLNSMEGDKEVQVGLSVVGYEKKVTPKKMMSERQEKMKQR